MNPRQNKILLNLAKTDADCDVRREAATRLTAIETVSRALEAE